MGRRRASTAPVGQFYTGVKIDGLDDLARDLKAYGRDVPRLLGGINAQAGQLIANRARAKAESLGGAARHVASSIRPSADPSAVVVSAGGAGAPAALGAEFGAKRNVIRTRNHSTFGRPAVPTRMRGWNQFRPWLGNQHQQGAGGNFGGGYFLAAAANESIPDFLKLYTRLFDELERQVFYERAT